MKKIMPAILLIILIISGTILNGCGSTSSKNMASSDSSYSVRDDANLKQEYGSDNGASSGESIEVSDSDITEDSGLAADDIALEGTAADAKQKQGEKLIYTYYYSVETKEFDTFTEKIAAKTIQLGGYVENSETSGSAADGLDRYANMTLRIPADQVNQLLSLLDTESNVTYRNSSIENISLQYVDLESHLKALRTEQETLLRLIEQADKIKDVIALQSQLTQVRYEIESYESQLRMYDNQVDYSTIHLDISEVERQTTVTPSRASFGQEVMDRFSDNLYAVGQWLRSLAVWLRSSLPILIPAVLLIVIAVFLIRKLFRYLKAHKPMQKSPQQSGYQSIYQKKNHRSADTPDEDVQIHSDLHDDNVQIHSDLHDDNVQIHSDDQNENV